MLMRLSSSRANMKKYEIMDTRKKSTCANQRKETNKKDK